MDNLTSDLVKKINQLSKWVNCELVGLAISLSMIIAGSIIMFMNWRVGHETAEELMYIDIGSVIFWVGLLTTLLLIITIITTAANRKAQIAILTKRSSQAVNMIRKPNILAIVLVSIPVYIIIVTLLVLLIPTIH